MYSIVNYGKNQVVSSTMSLFSSESVSPGHPDKVADQIADAFLDTVLTQDPNAW